MAIPLQLMQRTLTRYPLSAWLPYQAYDQEHAVYWLAGDRWGRCWRFTPLLGLDESTLTRLTQLFEMPLPAGTTYQIALHAGRDVRAWARQYQELRRHQPEIFQRWAARNVALVTQGADTWLIPSSKLPARDLQGYLSVTVPGTPTVAGALAAAETLAGVESLLQSSGLALTPLQPVALLQVLHQLLNPGHALEDEPSAWDSRAPLAAQAVRYDTMVQVSEHALWVDGWYVAALSAQQFPERWVGWRNRELIGSPTNAFEQLATPFWLSFHALRYDQTKASATLTRKHVLISNQAFGPMLKLVPMIGKKKVAFDEMMTQLAEGRQSLGVGYTLLVYARTLEELDHHVQAAQALYRSREWLLQRDRYIGLHQLLHALPMALPNDVGELRDKLRRIKTVHSGAAAQLAPLVGDWKGLGRPVVTVHSRAGQIMSLDLFANPTGNFNMCVAAKSGSGKSFFANELIMSYLSIGGRVWMIDAGKSYKKLCEQLERYAQYVEFSRHERELSLNPFATLGERDEESVAMLRAVIAQMMSPSRPLSDLERAYLEEQISELLDDAGAEASVTDLARRLLEHQDARVRDLGVMLYPYTRDGMYGHRFHGGSRLSFDAPFVVLELDGLDSMPELRSVVLLQLLLSIQQEMYLGDRGVKKICGLDEAWDLLSQGGATAEFFEKGVRRVRKYNGAILVITQGINDFYDKMGQTGRALLENSDFVCLLMQKPESIEALRQSKRLVLGDHDYAQLQSLHRQGTEYSEIFFYTPVGRGVGRLVVDRFSQLLYTTNADELARIEAVKRAQGCTTMEAIAWLVEHETHGAAPTGSAADPASSLSSSQADAGPAASAR